MKRLCTVLVLSLLAFAALTAQSPKGWMLRVDSSTSASDPDAPGAVKFVTMGSGFHATNPQAAVYWNPMNTVTGSYSLMGTFTLVKPSNHTNYYGLVFGGRDLERASQTYVYFLVAQDGTWLVKRRDGDAVTQNLVPKTASSLVKTPDASGQSINTLEVRVAGGAIEFVINGTVANRWLGAGRTITTDGVYGIRVNHFLEVHVDGFGVATRPGAATPDTSNSETVTMTATVEQSVSPTAFSVHQDTTAQDVLVLVPTLQRAVELHAPVTVFGRLVKLDPAEIARKANGYQVDLPADVTTKYRGRDVVIATAVLNTKMVDLTKRLPPPMTTDDQTLSGLMKRVAPAFAALRQAVDASNAAGTRQNAVLLNQAFTEIEALWTSRGQADATKWAGTARLQAEAIERDATSGTWDTVRASMGILGQQCQACHAARRETFDDGSFRIKMSRN